MNELNEIAFSAFLMVCLAAPILAFISLFN